MSRAEEEGAEAEAGGAGERARDGAESPRAPEELRIRGNAFFQQGAYAEAVEAYTLALASLRDGRRHHQGPREEEDGAGAATLVKVLTNRSAAYAKLGQWPESLVDAQRAADSDASSVRAQYRRGLALAALDCLAEALEAVAAARALDPANAQLRSLEAKVQARVRLGFQSGRAGEVERHRAQFETNLEERRAAESLQGELEAREARQAKHDAARRKATREEHERAFCDSAARKTFGGGKAGEEGEACHYAVLGLDPSCSAGRVRKQYLRMLTTCHPDKPQGSRAAFDAVKRAYDVLGNAARRRAYDEARSTHQV